MKRKIALIITSAVYTAASACLFAMNAFAEGEAASDTATQQAAGGSLVTFVLPLVLMFVLLYFMAIRPQRKKEQEAKAMQDGIQIGDEIVTAGGIVGMVVRIGDDNVVIETGGERNKLRIKKWAVAENTSANERAKESQPKTKTALSAAGVADEKDDKKERKSKKSEKSEDSSEE
ncbi:MAG: preprotein translocase subunit YajC [Ruminococcus sp.]|nr:preprotein translocase subunit YajC [Ruminococcus sp.]